MDKIVSLLKKLKWTEEPELVVKGAIDRPVYSRPRKKDALKIIVGPMWTTYYDIRKDVIGEMDSVKTDDYGSVEKIIRELSGA